MQMDRGKDLWGGDDDGDDDEEEVGGGTGVSAWPIIAAGQERWQRRRTRGR